MAYFWLGFCVVVGAGCGLLVFSAIVALVGHIGHILEWWWHA